MKDKNLFEVKKIKDKIYYLYNKYKFPVFILKIDDLRNIHIDFTIEYVYEWNCDDDKTPHASELYLSACIKFDGCSHVTFGEDEDGYLHLCGKPCWEHHCMLMNTLWDFASKNIEGFVG
jgi:hypothetical protein